MSSAINKMCVGVLIEDSFTIPIVAAKSIIRVRVTVSTNRITGEGSVTASLNDEYIGCSTFKNAAELRQALSKLVQVSTRFASKNIVPPPVSRRSPVLREGAAI